MESSAGTSTPVKSSSISLSALASGKTLGSMDQRIIEEIHRTVFSGFDPALFIEKLYPLVDETRTTALIECQFDSQSRQWKSWPEKPTEQLVIGWLDQWTKQIATVFGVVQSRPRGSGDTPLLDGDARRKPDVIFIDHNLQLPCPCNEKCEEPNYCAYFTLSWSRVRVVGELKQNPAESGCASEPKGSMVVTLAHRVREIFGTQPGRRYVHAFSLCGSLLRCFLFDRSGVVASEHFDIHSNPELTVRVFAAYLYGSSDWIGFDPTIRVQVGGQQGTRTYDPTAENRGDPFIEYAADGNTTKLYLDPKPLFLVPSIVSRGSICWRARKADSECDKWEYVIKDQWRHEQRAHEGELLKSLKGVDGVVQMEYYEDVMADGKRDDTQNAIRRDLDFPSQSVKAVRVISSKEEATNKANGTGALISKSWSSNSSRLVSATSNSKRHSLQPKGSHPPPHAQRPETPKRRRIASYEGECSPRESMSPYNRIHGRLVLCDVGRRLKNFQTREQLLRALRGAIEGYRNMLDQNIMHRDISINNIMIASSGTGGYLIDLDFAVLLSRDSISGAPHRTGTVEFMAIEVLEGLPHAPRHDLESFLYVLIWMFTKFPAPGDDSLKPDGGICEVDLWGNGSFRYISGIKSKLRDAQYSNLNSVYYSQFYPGWKKRSTSKLVIKWWGLLFNKKDPLDMTPEDRMLLEMSAGVVKPVRSLESLREEGLELSKKMIEALDKALEEVMQEDAEEVK